MGMRVNIDQFETNADGRTDQQMLHRSLNWGSMNWCSMLVIIFWQQGRRGRPQILGRYSNSLWNGAKRCCRAIIYYPLWILHLSGQLIILKRGRDVLGHEIHEVPCFEVLSLAMRIEHPICTSVGVMPAGQSQLTVSDVLELRKGL